MAIGDELVMPPAGPQPMYRPPALPTTPAPAAAVPQAVIPPAASPGDEVARMQAWRDALVQMQNDPAVQAGLMRLGTNLLKPIPRGTNTAGFVGSALQDSVDYATAQRQLENKNRMDAEQMALRRREVGAHERQVAESAASSQQARSQSAQKFPLELDMAAQNLRTAQQNFDKVTEEINQLKLTNAVITPDLLKREHDAKVALLNAQTGAYNAHANLYNSSANAMGDKNTGAHATKMDDRTTVFTHMKNGQRYVEVLRLPEESDPRAAAARATKEIEQDSGGWFGKKKYPEATKEDAIKRRTQELLSPQTIYLGPGGKQITQQQFDAAGGSTGASGAGATPGTPPAASPPGVIQLVPGPDGRLVPQGTQPVGAAIATNPDEQFVNVTRGGYKIDLGPRSALKHLNGKQYPTKEAALQAIKAERDKLGGPPSPKADASAPGASAGVGEILAQDNVQLMPGTEVTPAGGEQRSYVGDEGPISARLYEVNNDPQQVEKEIAQLEKALAVRGKGSAQAEVRGILQRELRIWKGAREQLRKNAGLNKI